MTPHLWVRAEQRANEDRVGLTPDGAKALIDAGFRLTVEASTTRILPLDGYVAAGADTAPEGSWPDAPEDAIIFGLKELPDDGTPLAPPTHHVWPCLQGAACRSDPFAAVRGRWRDVV